VPGRSPGRISSDDMLNDGGRPCDRWVGEATRPGRRIGYERGTGDVAALLKRPSSQAWDVFTVPMSMREVEPGVKFDHGCEGSRWGTTLEERHLDQKRKRSRGMSPLTPVGETRPSQLPLDVRARALIDLRTCRCDDGMEFWRRIDACRWMKLACWQAVRRILGPQIERLRMPRSPPKESILFPQRPGSACRYVRSHVGCGASGVDT